MDLLFVLIWLAVGLLGSVLGRIALRYRFPRTNRGNLENLDFFLALAGPFNVLAVIIVFGKDCFKRF